MRTYTSMWVYLRTSIPLQYWRLEYLIPKVVSPRSPTAYRAKYTPLDRDHKRKIIQKFVTLSISYTPTYHSIRKIFARTQHTMFKNKPK